MHGANAEAKLQNSIHRGAAFLCMLYLQWLCI